MKLNNILLNELEKVFESEAYGLLYQCNNKSTKHLEEIGFIQKVNQQIGRDGFVKIAAEGFVTTISGNYYYCTSERFNKK